LDLHFELSETLSRCHCCIQNGALSCCTAIDNEIGANINANQQRGSRNRFRNKTDGSILNVQPLAREYASSRREQIKRVHSLSRIVKHALDSLVIMTTNGNIAQISSVPGSGIRVYGIKHALKYDYRSFRTPYRTTCDKLEARDHTCILLRL
jgi:hypothetical protein